MGEQGEGQGMDVGRAGGAGHGTRVGSTGGLITSTHHVPK